MRWQDLSAPHRFRHQRGSLVLFAAMLVVTGVCEARQVRLPDHAGADSPGRYVPAEGTDAEARATGWHFYVAPDGSDTATGSADEPFRSIQQALDSGPTAGDEIIVRAGTYHETLNIHAGGSPEGHVTLRAETPGSAILMAPAEGWNAISINDNYVTVQGFEIIGAVGDGIEANNVHHIEVLDNVIHGSGESGIQFNWSEFIRIEGNTTYRNASAGWFSGISVYQNRNITGDTSTSGFRTILRNNISYENHTRTGEHSDGNGIIIDDFQSTHTDGFPNYVFPTLVENNLVYLNGGKGIQIVWSDRVTVRNNTAWHNNQDLQNSGAWRGEISNSQSSNNRFVNNIAVADPGVNPDNTAYDNTSLGSYTNRNIVWRNNLSHAEGSDNASVRIDGGNAMPRAEDGNLLGVDPEFRAAPGDFRLAGDSPAIDAGKVEQGQAARDLTGADRIVGQIDLGAFETQPGSLSAKDVTGQRPSP
jgi:parallel beta-helix repeat protein